MNMQLNARVDGGVATPMFLTAKAIKARVQAIQEVMEAVMHEGQHYYSLGAPREVKLADGSTLKSPNYALSKSGAEVLCMTFQLAPEIVSEFTERDEVTHWKSRRKEYFNGPTGRTFEWKIEEGDTDGYYEVLSTCRIYGPNQNLLASAQGSTNNLESKYRTQNLADVKNTLLKMSQKRAFVAAVLLATGASDLFSQDLVDEEEPASSVGGAAASTSAKPATTATGSSSAHGEFGTSVSEAQRKACYAAAKSAGIPSELSDAVIHLVSHLDKKDSRPFMDIVFSRDEAKIKAAFESLAPKETAPTASAPATTAPVAGTAPTPPPPAGAAAQDPLWDDPPEGRVR